MPKFHFTKEPKNGSYIITAFQTVGFISILAVKYLEEKGALKEIGFLEIDTEEPIALISDGKIDFPIRVLEGGNGVFITSQFPLPKKSVDELVSLISDLYKKYSSKGILTLDGLAVERAKEVSDVYYVSTDEKTQIPGAKKLDEGAMVGLNAALVLNAKLAKLPLTVLMAETHSEIPDGLAASALINVLNSLTGIKVNTDELVSEYRKTLSKINATLRKIAEQPKEEPPSNPELYG